MNACAGLENTTTTAACERPFHLTSARTRAALLLAAVMVLAACGTKRPSTSPIDAGADAHIGHDAAITTDAGTPGNVTDAALQPRDAAQTSTLDATTADANDAFDAGPQTFTYRNPILWNGNEELRDPCIIREADTYYLVFTVFPFTNNTSADPNKPDYNSSPGIKLYTSTDLTHWTFSKWLVKSSELPDTSPYKHRFWAPEIHKIGGRFFLIFTADNWIKDSYNVEGHMGGFAFVGVSNKVDGPYQHISYIKGGAIDTTLFEAADGKTYAMIPRGGVDVQEIDLTKIDQDKVQLVGNAKRVIDPSDKDVGIDQMANYLEGPWVTYRNQRYYAFYAANFGDSGGYWTGVAYADSPLGPWKKDAGGSKFFWGGHVAVFDGPDHRMWFSYRGEKFRDSWGRLGIDPIDTDSNGRAVAIGPTYMQDQVITYWP